MPSDNNVPAAEFMVADGPDGPVSVYHVYKNDDVNGVRRTMLYTLDEYGCEDDPSVFDVRELSYEGLPDEIRDRAFAGDEDAIKRVITRAITTGRLKAPEEE